MAGRTRPQEVQDHVRMAKRLRSRRRSSVRELRGTSRWPAAVIISLLAVGCAAEEPVPMNTISDFQVKRYLGQWHQVAAIPAWFQSDCAANTKATYALADDGLVAGAERAGARVAEHPC